MTDLLVFASVVMIPAVLGLAIVSDARRRARRRAAAISATALPVK